MFESKQQLEELLANPDLLKSKQLLEEQLEELLADPSFMKILALITSEVMRKCNVERSSARNLVLSAIGDPKALTAIWIRAKKTGELGLAKVIVRRRVLDLLDKEARPARQAIHRTLMAYDISADITPGSSDSPFRDDPYVQFEYRQIIHLLQSAIYCFSLQNTIASRQACLLRRYFLDGISYCDLSEELGCNMNALRVRVHKALGALRKHIQECHPELVELFNITSLVGRT